MHRSPRCFMAVAMTVLGVALVCSAGLAQGPGWQGGQQPAPPGGWMGGWQGGPGPGPGAGPGPGGPGGPGFGPFNPMAGAMMMRAMAQPAIAVANGKVFIAAGGVLYRFNAETLELELQVEYAPLMQPMGPGGPGGPPGQGGMFPLPQPPGG